MTAEVPVWVFGRCRWVSGVCRRTTCQDVLEAVLSAPAPHGGDGGPGGPPSVAADGVPSLDPASYVILERWRGVERRLDGRVRILKVWSAWGEAQSEVQLEVRRVSEKGSLAARHRAGGGGGGAAGGRRHRKRTKPAVSHEQEHEVHRLMRLILAQGETIAGQLRRLREREAQIERIEAETHRDRVARHGKDYVLAAYLKDAEEEGGARKEEETPRQPGRPGCVKPRKLQLLEDDPADMADESDAEVDGHGDTEAAAAAASSSSTQDADGGSGSGAVPSGAGAGAGGGRDRDQDEPAKMDRDELRSRIALWEKVVKVNKRLEQQEERLVRLYVGFRRSAPDQAAVDDRKELRVALSRLQQEIEDGRRDLQANADLLMETESLLDAKRRFLRRLHLEIEAADMDTQRLMAVKEASPALPSSQTSLPIQGKTTTCITPCTQASTQTGIKSHSNDNDSNSDTGLSSLHSSSEEGVYILDTLV